MSRSAKRTPRRTRIQTRLQSWICVVLWPRWRLNFQSCSNNLSEVTEPSSLSPYKRPSQSNISLQQLPKQPLKSNRWAPSLKSKSSRRMRRLYKAWWTQKKAMNLMSYRDKIPLKIINLLQQRLWVCYLTLQTKVTHESLTLCSQLERRAGSILAIHWSLSGLGLVNR